MISISSTVNWRRTLPVMLVFLSACGGSGSAGSDPVVTPTPTPPVTSTDAVTDHGFITDHFIGSQNCTLCHDGLRDAAGTDVSIVIDWQATMMANSARDPLWRAKVASEVKRNPALEEEIESTCARCHVPMASVEAGFASVGSTLFGDTGLLHPDNPLFDAANEGVSCTLCHQIEDTAALGTDDGFSGQFSIGFDFGIDRELNGQYANPLTMPMQNAIGFTPAASAHVSTSELCATCHNLSTPVLDAQGNFTNQLFPEQMVYTEWENSQFAATDSCQDCHMPKVVGDMRISTRPLNGLAARSSIAEHTFIGANTYMLDILGQNKQQLNITANGFDALVAETRSVLMGAASLSLENMLRVGDDLDFSVRLTNFSGHKFPSGYPSRRAWLHVTITDASGATVFESGAIDTMGKITGVESDSNPAGFEPHYDIITSADLVHYQISGLIAGTYTVAARLNYQTMSYGFGQDLFNDVDVSQVALFKDLDDNARLRFETISSAAGSVDF